MSLGFDIWKSIVIGYISPKNTPTNETKKNPSKNNEKSTNVILCGLSESEFVKVMHCVLTKQIWEKLQNIYEGHEKVDKTTPNS